MCVLLFDLDYDKWQVFRGTQVNVNAKLHYVDYNKLLMRIQTPNKSKGLLAGFFAKTARVAISPFIVRKIINTPSILKRLIFNITDDYGVVISELTIDGKIFLQSVNGKGGFLNASIIVDNIDCDKLSALISESINSTGKSNHNATLTDVIRIIKPFIGETIATIPPPAIAELFELLAKDKVIEYVEHNYGIAISDVVLTPIES